MVPIREACTVVAVLVVAAAAPSAGSAVEPKEIDFGRDVRPILSANCFQCHGSDPAARKAKLRLDKRDDATRDRGGYFAIKPGDPSQSDLVARITSKEPDEVMPPPKHGHPLTSAEIELLKRWIKEGAKYSEHWAFVKPRRPALPRVKDPGARLLNAIDHFVVARLDSAGLAPSPPADRHTLIRRLALDLTGLPPTPAEVDAFVNDTSPRAYEALVDRLLQSSAYGERWARMWLDLARYADSSGYGSDPLRLNIWPYRDWVISAFNRNLPYDRFSLEQLAGDLLPKATQDQMVATAFHRNTMTNTEGGTDDEEFRIAAVKDRVATTVQVWMGLTMGCAQCHSHKFDPITQKEFYQFFALFNQTEDFDQPDERPTMALLSPAQQEAIDRLKTQIQTVESKLQAVTPAFLAELAAWEQEQAKSVTWVPLDPVEYRFSRPTPVTKNADLSLNLPKTESDQEILTVKSNAALQGITAVRLEVLPALEKKAGSGTGKLVVRDIRLSTRSQKTTPGRVRHVRVELPGPNRILSLAEVQVLSGGRNIALSGKARQSSTDYDGPAKLAIDGNTNGDYQAAKSTTHTRTEDNPWWEVDLGSEHLVDNVHIWNRTDAGLGTRLTDFRVLAMDASRKTIDQVGVSAPPMPDVLLHLDSTSRVLLQNATANLGESGSGAPEAIDANPRTGWGAPLRSGQPALAVFQTPQPVGKDGDVSLAFTLTISSNEASCVRLSVTTAKHAVRVLPDRIAEILAVDPSKRSAKQKEELLGFYRPMARVFAPDRELLGKLKTELSAIKPVPVPVMRELPREKQRVTRLLKKGDFLTPGDKVDAGFIESIHEAQKKTPHNRLGVAQWLFSRDNPLTARVAVNRFWARIFDTGIVETEEDFGTQGQLPSHPELLDWLAVEFMDRGWDVKALLKTIVMSATYQQSSRTTPQALAMDPRNRLLSRYPRRRLDAETVRDQALAVSGLLSRKIGGPSVYPPQPDGLWRAAFNGERTWSTSQGEDRYRRGIYTFWRRTIPYPSMATFDAPSRENCTLRRLPTNTPLQAFVTLNDPCYVEMAQALGRRLVREGGRTTAERIRYGLKLVLCRQATDEQLVPLIELFDKCAATYRKDLPGATRMAVEPLGPLPPGLDVAEQAAWTVVANILLNLDSVLTKG